MFRKMISCILVALFIVSTGISNKVMLKSRTVLASESSTQVLPIDWTSFSNGYPMGSQEEKWELMLKRNNKYVINKLWKRSPLKGKEGEYITFGTNETGTRPYAFYAYSTAVSLALGLYDEAITGIPEELAMERTITIIKSLAKGHLINEGYDNGTTWGNVWQSSQWAAYIGCSAWLVWDDLETNDQEYIKNMIVYEANRFINMEAEHADHNSTKDTKAEEVGWNSRILELAHSMMPYHDNNDIWRNKAIEFRMTAIATPYDEYNETIYDGRPVKDWVTGYNILPMGALGNHGHFPHPAYSGAPIWQSLSSMQYYGLGRQEIPEAHVFNQALVNKFFVDEEWSSPPYASPGGTIYQNDGTIYWPIQYSSDRRFRYYKYASTSALTKIAGTDDGASIPASTWEELFADRLYNDQAKDPIYWESGENSRGEYNVSASLATIVLMYYLSNNGLVIPQAPTPEPIVEIPNMGEDFENGIGEHWSSHEGSPVTSSVQAHSGLSSFAVDQDKVELNYNIGYNANKVAVIWFYDDADDTSANTMAYVDDVVTECGIGVNTSEAIKQYVYRIGSKWSTTSIPRETGWHKFVYDYRSGNDVKLYIDDSLVCSSKSIKSFLRIWLGDTESGQNMKAYFDDIQVVDCYDAPEIPLFQSGFENGFNGWETRIGTPALSKDVVHSGTFSYGLSQDREGIRYNADSQLNKVAVIWLYDNAEDTTGMAVAGVNDSVTTCTAGIHTEVSAEYYVTRLGADYSTTSVKRTTGWHKLTFDYSSGNGVVVYIDNIPVLTSSLVSTFNKIWLGDSVKEGTISAYFDDVQIIDSLE